MRKHGPIRRAGVGGRHHAEDDLRSSKRCAEIAGDFGVVRYAHAREVDGIFAGLAQRGEHVRTMHPEREAMRLAAAAERDGQRGSTTSGADDGDLFGVLAHGLWERALRRKVNCGSVPRSSRMMLARWRTIMRSMANDAPPETA